MMESPVTDFMADLPAEPEDTDEQGRRPLAYSNQVALAIADWLVREGVVERIEIAGSIRREKPFVKDIELVAIPRMEWRQVTVHQGTLLEETATESVPFSLLDGFLNANCAEGMLLDWQINERGNRAGDGPRYKKLRTCFPFRGGGTNVDLFLASEENWGNVLTIRTGDGEWSREMMYAARQRGLVQKDGFLYRGETVIPCRTEQEYFDAIGWPWTEPKHRNIETARRLMTAGRAA